MATTFGLWLAERFGLRQRTWLHLLARAALVSIMLTLFMVPSGGLHGIVDAGLS